jgi:hypothetical protein
MRKTVLALTLLAALAHAGNRNDYVEKTDYVHPLAANGRLILRNEVGDIRIHASDRNDVRITAIRRAHNTSESEGPSRVKELEVQVEHSESEVRVTGSHPRGMFSGVFHSSGNLELDFDVELPRNARIEVVNNIGDIHIDGTSADVNVRENIGDVNVDFVTGFHPRMVTLDTNIGEVSTNLQGQERGFLGKKFTALQDGEHSLTVKLNIGDIHVHTDGVKDEKRKSRKPVDM